MESVFIKFLDACYTDTVNNIMAFSVEGITYTTFNYQTEDKGWLVFTHGVDIDYERGKNSWEDKWQKRYCAGMLLDLNEPRKAIGVYRDPLLVPEADYEAKDGFRTNVIFPTAAIKEDDDTVKV